MHYAPYRAPDVTTKSDRDSAFWRKLLYRWFVQYNPAYLLSAAFVFAGCFLWSKGVVHESNLTSTLGIPLLAELYALSLVGGAALLTRIGQRRPAVILALIFVVYQWDTTLHTEACAYLGSVGAGAALAWLAIFIAKLYAMSWALRIRVARRMIAAGVIAGVGLVIAPHVLSRVGDVGGGGLIAAWIFSLISLYDGASISSLVSLDTWGQTVLSRVTKATWILSGVMIALHVVMWTGSYPMSLLPTILGLPLLAVPRVRAERKVWIIAVLTLGATLLVAPGAFFVIAILASGALCLRVVAKGRIAELTPAQRFRCWSGALFSLYLGGWAMTSSHGVPVHHVLTLDVALTLVVLFAAWRSRARVTFLVPLAATYVHFVAQARLIPVPRSQAAIGETVIALGFALLGGALLVSYKLRGFDVDADRSLNDNS